MITCALIVTAVLLIFGSLYFKKTKNYPPGPFQWPVVGNLFLLRKLSRKFNGQSGAFLELCRWYRSDVVALRFGSSDTIVVSGQETIRSVLHSSEYDGRPWNEFIKLRNFGIRNGITMADGPAWQELRAWVLRKLRLIGLGRRQMSDLMMEELNEIMKTVKDGGIFRIKHIIAPAIMNVLWVLITGKRFQDEQKLQYFFEIMERRVRVFDMSGGILSALPWMRHIAPRSLGYDLLITINNELKEFLMKTINENKSKYTPDSQDNLIDMFLNEMYSENSSSKHFTDEQLVMVIMDLFIAGLNTTATTLDFAFLNMILNPDVQERLHKEIDEEIGKDRIPDLNDRPRLAYVEAVLTESQRLCLIAPIVGPRRVLKDTNLLGYVIPKETTVLMNMLSINMNPDLFPEPDKFQPERFLKNGAYVPDERLILFGEGKRRCLGETLARCALFIIFVGVMQQYRLLPVPGEERPTLTHVPGIIITPKPYNVLLIPRQTVPASFNLPN